MFLLSVSYFSCLGKEKTGNHFTVFLHFSMQIESEMGLFFVKGNKIAKKAVEKLAILGIC